MMTTGYTLESINAAFDRKSKASTGVRLKTDKDKMQHLLNGGKIATPWVISGAKYIHLHDRGMIFRDTGVVTSVELIGQLFAQEDVYTYAPPIKLIKLHELFTSDYAPFCFFR